MKPGKIILILFFLVLITGFFLRVFDLGHDTLGYGEVEVYQSALEFSKGNFLNNFYIFAETPLSKYIFTLSLLLIREPLEISLRIVPALFGFFTIIVVFLFTQKLYNDYKIALFASLFTSLSIIHIQFSRYVQFEAALSFFYVTVFYFLWSFLEKRSNKNAIFLGITLSLGILIKTAFINALITIILFAVLYKIITIKIKPSFSLVVDNKFIKAMLVAIITFFLIWPISLIPLPVHLTIDVQGHVNQVSTNIPTLFLVFGYRFTETSKAITNNFFLSVPLIGFLFFFIVKESELFVVLFFAGLLAMHKNFSKKQDTFILVITVVFFILTWIQSVRYTYRYITIIIPFISIIAARSIYFLKSKKNTVNNKIDKKFLILFFAIFAILFFIAFTYTNNYPLYYNGFQGIFNIP